MLFCKFCKLTHCKFCKLLIMQKMQINILQKMQCFNYAESASCQQLTQQHSITLPLYQFDLIYGPSTDRIGCPAIRSPGRPVPVTAPGGQTGRPCRTVCQSARRPNIWHGPYRYALERVPLGGHRTQSRHGVTQSHLKPCPLLTFWASRLLRPVSANSLPTASRLPYGLSPLRIG